MQELEYFAERALGLDVPPGTDLDSLQMACRAVVVFLFVVIVVRVGNRRFMSEASAIDVILGIMLGSVASRAISGTAPFIPSLCASAVLLAMHWLLSFSAKHSSALSFLAKGRSRILVSHGTLNSKEMARSGVAEEDLRQDLRRHGISDLRDVEEARIERNGRISVIRANARPDA